MTELNLTLAELLSVVEGESSLNPSFLIRNVAALEHAGEHDLAVVFDPDNNEVFGQLSLDVIKNSKAGLFLASRPIVEGKQYLIVKDPLAAFERITNKVRTKNAPAAGAIHPSAVVDQFAVLEDRVTVRAHAVIREDAKVGQGTYIGENVFIGAGAIIGCDVYIHPGVKVLDRCVIGDNTILHSGAVIGSDGFGYRVTKTGMRKVPHVGIVKIGAHVEIGAGTTIDRAEFDATVIGDGVKIDNLVHIAHNVKIGPCTAILAQTAIAGSAVIGAGCQIGGQVAIKDHIVIGNGVKIVAKSGVMKNLADGEVVAGSPSVAFTQWKRQAVAAAQMPDVLKQIKEIAPLVQALQKKRSLWKTLFSWW